MKTFRGVTVSQGFAIGRIYKKEAERIEDFEQFASNTEQELNRLNTARKDSLDQLEVMRQDAIAAVGEDSAEIFEAHQSFLEDDCFFETIEEAIRQNNYSAPFAVKKAGDDFISSLGQVKDQYIAERVSDIKDIFQTLLRNLTSKGVRKTFEIPEHTILVAKELTPSDTMNLDLRKVDAFITETGGKNSHVAIIARAAGKVALVGVQGVFDNAENGEEAAVDGEAGELYLSPDNGTLSSCKDKYDGEDGRRKKLLELIGKPAETPDGHRVELFANIAIPEDAYLAMENDAMGVGLFRTEFVFINRSDYPSEEEQFERYREAALALKGKTMIVRTLDVGGDKSVPYFGIPQEENPFLGYRAIRICLDRKELFQTQLRAILKASAYGKIKIMFPMISGVDELRGAKQAVREAMESLEAQGIGFDKTVAVGTMIEVPSAAVLADFLAEECDFFSIGTNDLVQYSLAADRGNANVASLYSPFHPAVLRLIGHVVACAHARNIPVGVCGESAADAKMIPLLLGLGVDELSVAPAAVLECKQSVRGMSFEKMRLLTEKAMKLATAAELEAFLASEITI